MSNEAKQQQGDQSQVSGRNDPAIDPVPADGAPPVESPKTDQTAKDNDYSPDFKPKPTGAKPGEETDADIDTDGG
ncbi:MAG: hypothetical protein PW845_05315 [Pseudomonas sp.]|uniref:hypothetical protein n=1 Tax=Pseudomonas abieticivorans TaxID=2931382 RepID=UPI0020BE70D5|nr:hypothetical protein [Pseudomonas sp. PIA16]MDE1164806.1 hypothetical protein [Pseudomonas sp.]